MRRTWIRRAHLKAHDGDEHGRPGRAPHPALQLQAKVGNRTASQLLAGSEALQCLLRVGPVDDPLEREADLVAADVVHRIGGAVEATGDGVDKRAEQPEVRRRPAGEFFDVPGSGRDGGLTSPDVEAAIVSARGGGRRLEPPVLRQMEGAFGLDFGDVRVHTDAESDRLSRRLNARAFTFGSDIFFSRGEYNPGSTAGRSVLAHELTHVLQQGAASGGLAPAGGRYATSRFAHPVVQREVLPTGRDLQSAMDADGIQSVQLTMSRLFHRLHAVGRLRDAEGERFSTAAEALQTVFHEGISSPLVLDLIKYRPIREQSMKAPSPSARDEPVRIKESDWLALKPVMARAAQVAYDACKNLKLVEDVLGPLQDATLLIPTANFFSTIGTRLKTFLEDGSHVLVNYRNVGDETGAGGAARPGSGQIELSYGLVKGIVEGIAEKENAAITTMIHEAAHETNASVVDLGYAGTPGFEFMTVKDKLSNAAHYEEVASRVLGTSKFMGVKFVPKSGVLAGTDLKEILVKNAKNANTGLEELWRMSVNLPDVRSLFEIHPSDNEAKVREKKEMTGYVKEAYGIPSNRPFFGIESIDRSLIDTTAMVLRRAMVKMKALVKASDPSVIEKYAHITSSYELGSAAIQKAGGLEPDPFESDQRHYKLVVFYQVLNGRSPYP